MIKSLTRKVILCAVLTGIAPGVVAAEWQFDDVQRVVAISDIHGAYTAMVETLKNAGVIDETLGWSGRETHLVIVGDLLDRGPDSRLVMDLLMRLEGEASAAGGRIHVLIGNHEAMNLSGDLRYVSDDEFAAFADEELPTDRERWFNAWLAGRAPAGADAEVARVEFNDHYPPGYFGHRRAFAPDGKYGSWLLSKPVIIVINGTAFVHGGLSPMVIERGLQGVNGELLQELDTYVRALETVFEHELLLPTDSHYEYKQRLSRFSLEAALDAEVARAVADVVRLDDSDLQAPDGPLWYRGNVFCNRIVEVDRLNRSLAAIGATRVVIGHTPSFGRRILERFDGQIYEVDTGMLASYYKGSGNALVMEGDRLFVINQANAEAVPPSPQPRQVGRRPGGQLLAEDIELLLRSGDIVARSEDESGRVIVSVSNGEQTIDAEFVRNARRVIYPDVAAYRLDRLLEFDMVPVAVKRAVDNKDGSLQFVPTRWIDEQQRQADKSGGGAYCPLPVQWDAMLVFDILMGNEQRSASSIRYDSDSFQLMLVGHEKSFSTSGSKPAVYKNVPLKMNPAWNDALSALTDHVLNEQFADVLDKKRIKALAKRRDLLLSE